MSITICCEKDFENIEDSPEITELKILRYDYLCNYEKLKTLVSIKNVIFSDYDCGWDGILPPNIEEVTIVNCGRCFNLNNCEKLKKITVLDSWAIIIPPTSLVEIYFIKCYDYATIELSEAENLRVCCINPVFENDEFIIPNILYPKNKNIFFWRDYIFRNYDDKYFIETVGEEEYDKYLLVNINYTKNYC